MKPNSYFDFEAMAEGKMKLHGIASSTCTGRVLVTLFEKEVEDFELQVVNVRKGEGKTPEHMALQVNALKFVTSIMFWNFGTVC